MSEGSKGFTKTLANFIADTDASKIPVTDYEHAKAAFLDWLAVTIGGKDDPLVLKLIKYSDMMGGDRQATIIGHKTKKSPSHAALINGASSHALDYDDTLVSFFGHPSVTLFPALLALAEWKEKSGRDFIAAYLIGLQVGSTVGASAGMEHYMAGWHATSTLGHIASAAGCARLLGLDAEKAGYALGIGATQSSGLKRVFGTMCKPFHAGRASESGLMAALLAEQGFTSAEDILEGPLGFFHVFKGKPNKEKIALLGTDWDVRNLAQKYHASCHATHSPLEAVLAVVKNENIPVNEIKSIRVYSSKLAMDAAGKMTPSTGLEGKFSISYCVANALLRGVTGNRAFTDTKVNDPIIKEFMKKIAVSLDPEIKALESRVEVETNSGKNYNGFSDVLQQIPPLEMKKERIRDKFLDMSEPVMGKERSKKVVEDVNVLEKIRNMKPFAEMLG